jgi:4-amino-4-deoxy-L-arabinose transferase-like glycosyltransferase
MTAEIKSQYSKNILIHAERWIFYVTLFIALSFILRLSSIGLSDLLVEEAYYWNYAAHLDWSYLDHPPMVALLIKASTGLFGTHEWGVRLPSILCWGIAAFFSYRLTNLMGKKGLYAVFLLSILPFFFLQSWVMTPDQPLLAAWSCALYCLYRACVLNEARYWYFSGLSVGLGLLSKYTIVLLGPSVLLYLSIAPSARFWFYRKEPYVAASIALLVFSPVIYWNAVHDWISFTFQSSRRLNEAYQFSLHQLLGLAVLFLMPTGVWGLFSIFKKKISKDLNSKRFMQIFTCVPLIVFGLFSLMHPVKFNWIGPGLLALIPWLAAEFELYKKSWLVTGLVLLLGYFGMMFVMTVGQPVVISRLFFSKYIAWEDFSRHVFRIASHLEDETHTHPIIVPLDKYNIGSELSFYQAKQVSRHKTTPYFSIRGSHIFGGESLMYRYWSISTDLSGKMLILISDNPRHFDNPAIIEKAQLKTPVQAFESYTQGSHFAIRPYYYQVIKMN